MHKRVGRAWFERSLAVLSFALPVLLLLIYLWARHGSVPGLLRALGYGDTPLHDYRAFFYPMGRQLLTDPRPVEGFLYSPLAALLFVPLGLLPYAPSAWLWAALLLLATGWLAHQAYQAAGGQPRLGALGVGLTVASVPLLHDLKFGQVSVLIVAALVASARCYAAERRGSAALWLALASAFKFYPALFLSYFVFKRDVRFVLLVLGLLIVLLLIVPFMAIGPATTLAFYRGVAEQLDQRFGGDVADANAQSLTALSRRMLGESPAARLAGWALRAASWLGLLEVTRRMARSPEREAVERAFLWLFLATPFLVVTSWPHYFVYLPLTCTTIFAASRDLGPRARRVARTGAAVAAATSSIIAFDLLGNRKLYVRFGALFWANAAAMLALLAVFYGRTSAGSERS